MNYSIKVDAFDYIFTNAVHVSMLNISIHIFHWRNYNAPEEECCVLCLNKTIKLNILFICFIAHADDLMCVVCLSIDRHSLISELISFFLLLRFLLFRPSASATANGSEDDRATAYLLCNTSNESDAMQIFHEIGFIFLNTYISLIWGLCSHLVPTSATLLPFPFIHSNGWYTYLN